MLAASAPAVTVELKQPFHDFGLWWVGIQSGDNVISIAWRQGEGFEFFPDEEPSFGLKAEEFVRSADEAYQVLRRRYRDWNAFGAAKHSARA